MNSAVMIDNVWKNYTLRHNGSFTIKGKLLSIFHSRLREQKENFWALKNINLNINKGETIGIIGPNGAGKSTLMYLVTQTLMPDKGSVRVNGVVAPLIELGLGFSKELTGIENIHLNLSLYGYGKSKILSLIDSIVDFSGIRNFIDSPIKNYSTGMNARLGFSIAVHLDPDILVLDEVFAVGDADFQKKCIKKMNEFKEKDKTILFVSHTMGAVRMMCDRACLVHNGEIILDGGVEEVTSKYEEFSYQ